MYNKQTKITFCELCLVNFLFLLRCCPIYQISRKMQKIKFYIISELPSGNKQDHAFKNLEINQGKMKQGYLCGQSVTSNFKVLC